MSEGMEKSGGANNPLLVRDKWYAIVVTDENYDKRYIHDMDFENGVSMNAVPFYPYGTKEEAEEVVRDYLTMYYGDEYRKIEVVEHENVRITATHTILSDEEQRTSEFGG